MADAGDVEREFAREHVVPLDQVFGRQTLRVVRSVQTATAAILRRPTRAGRRRLPDYERLTPWKALTRSQLSALREILEDPSSYWNGWPKYRRFPPRPGLAFQLSCPGSEAVLLIDLHNPGWEFFCGDERYWGFNFVGRRLVVFAKAVFPEYASNNSKSVWKKGAPPSAAT